jgi:hypothetical protein
MPSGKKNLCSLEIDLKREIRNTKVQKAILHSIATAGVLAVAVVAPNALVAMGPALSQYERQRKYRAKKVFFQLVGRGYIALEKTNKGSHAHLTEKGKRAWRQAEITNFEIKKPRRWDKKWRVIIFDIPETRKALRNSVRALLSQFGFVRLQDSVWVYPYDCEELIMLLKVEFRLGKSLLYLVVDRLENDRHLRTGFNLS